MPGVIGSDLAGLSPRRRRNPLARSFQTLRGQTVALEVVLEPLDLFLLAVHVVDVVAKKQVQGLLAVSRQLQLDRIELEQQIVAESANDRESRVLDGVEILDQRAQNRKGRRLLAALFFREKLRQRLEPATERGAFEPKFLPVRMRFEQRE